MVTATHNNARGARGVGAYGLYQGDGISRDDHPDRIAHHDPAPSAHLVHEEGVAGLADEESLVAGEGEHGLAATCNGSVEAAR